MSRPEPERRARAPSVAVAIPAYNEADGIGEFLLEIDRSLAPMCRLALVVVDDASGDGTREALEAVKPHLQGQLSVLRNEVNQGHGPSLLKAYREALSDDPDFVVQVDGDGQFSGADLRRVLVLLRDGSRAVGGVRRFRQDPWFRMTMTRLVGIYVRRGFRVGARDPNCPLRGYEAGALRDLLSALPEACLIPNLYLTIIGSRRGLALLEVDVSHRVRRGGSAQGVTWAKHAWSPIPWRLVRFSMLALLESLRFASHIGVLAAGGDGDLASPPPPGLPDEVGIEADLDRVERRDRAIVEQALPYTMTGVARLEALVDAVRHVVRRDLPGDLVECGVWRGGSVLAMILTLQDMGVEDRDLYLFDTFAGMTEPSERDVSPYEQEPALDTWKRARHHAQRPWPDLFGGEDQGPEAVRATLLATGYPPDRVHLVVGDVTATLPTHAPEDIALLRLDTDWYESTRHELIHLYPRLREGGVLIIDDYGHWQGARRAVDEFFDSNAPRLLLGRIDYTARMAVKA